MALSAALVLRRLRARVSLQKPRDELTTLELLPDRHQALMRVYRARESAGGRESGATTADLELLRREFRFVRDEAEDAARGACDWRVRMSVRYYRRLFREYALADLSRFREGKVGLRWRTEAEVVAGKGQFSCGNKRCQNAQGLRSYELLFAYREQGERRRCLVKLRACQPCARKLFFKKLQEKEEREQRSRRKKRRREGDAKSGRDGKRRRQADGSESDASSGSEAEEDIHARCAAINEQEMRAIGDAARPAGDEEGSRDDELLARLIP